jgi:hypothetical protein
MSLNETKTTRKQIDVVLVVLMLFNAIGTTMMYSIVLLLGHHSNDLDILRTQAYSVADIPFSVLPQFIAVYAIISRKYWAPIAVLFVASTYMQGITVMMVEDVLSGRIGPMFSMDFYFLTFALFAFFWAKRGFGVYAPYSQRAEAVSAG